MSSRYSKYPFIQPTRVITPSIDDIIITFKAHDNVDNLADKYYSDPTLGWVIMCANPDFNFEFEIPTGAKIRIPMPIDRVWKLWGEKTEI